MSDGINATPQAGGQYRELRGKCAVVTGSTSGIGLGIARTFAQAGMKIVLNGFGPASEIEALRAEMSRSFGVAVVYSAADMSKPGEIMKMIDLAVKDF